MSIIYIYHIIYIYISSYIGDKSFRIHAIEPTPKRNERGFSEPNKWILYMLWEFFHKNKMSVINLGNRPYKYLQISIIR